ncbi:hypothetical protein RchiOBHm_Chr6g0276031 [Rosa chinensis]|uniref:Uncharacterized protein n=1 Tax=Rosa chinensis TaxID=74649 RepID=A0A2P6PS77_ROSCH|nr:hypothetical protein RchiOBHm_Chr6g0276031 [Rosa chinensis]
MGSLQWPHTPNPLSSPTVPQPPPIPSFIFFVHRNPPPHSLFLSSSSLKNWKEQLRGFHFTSSRLHHHKGFWPW